LNLRHLQVQEFKGLGCSQGISQLLHNKVLNGAALDAIEYKLFEFDTALNKSGYPNKEVCPYTHASYLDFLKIGGMVSKSFS
jgi:hypothetical protein